MDCYMESMKEIQNRRFQCIGKKTQKKSEKTIRYYNYIAKKETLVQLSMPPFMVYEFKLKTFHDV